MALYNKDGTLYRLQGPNPVMKTQTLWDNYQLHNMNWEPQTAEDSTVVVPMQPSIKVQETFIEELQVNQPDIKVVETKNDFIEEKPAQTEIKVTENKQIVEPEQIKQKSELQPAPVKPHIETTDDIEKTYIHVLPATIRQKKDHLYGESYQTIEYGKPTSFEGVILEHSDIYLKIWTDTDIIKSGSVLYPKMQVKRWWRVQEINPKAGGFILICMPSDYQPSFDF